MNDMALPADKTCFDCGFHYHCKRLFGCAETNTTCDWSPSRFSMRVERETKTIDLFAEQAS
jgi:hypothetical protein